MSWTWQERRVVEAPAKLAVNDDPNTTAPDAVMVKYVQAQANQGWPYVMTALASGGTAADVLKVVWWVYDDTGKKWWPITEVTTVPLAGEGIAQPSIYGNFVGAKIFAQITENSGTITEFVWVQG